MDSSRQDELVKLLIKELPETLGVLQKSVFNKNYETLKYELHKLKGALCYCSLPDVEKLVNEFELALKNKQYNKFSSLLSLLQNYIITVL